MLTFNRWFVGVTLVGMLGCESFFRPYTATPPDVNEPMDVENTPDTTTPPVDSATEFSMDSGAPNTSCAGVCGLPFNAPGSCQCHAGCVATNVCCDDFEAICADWLFPKPPPDDQERSRETGEQVGCFYDGIPLWGDVKVVDSFADLEVQVVDAFPDLKVRWVDAFPDECGLWKEVDAFPDFTIRYVDSFADVKIKLVDSFAGL